MFTLIVTAINQETDTYTFRTLDEAYAAYDRAINLGYYVDKFINWRGTDMRDKPQSAITYNN